MDDREDRRGELRGKLVQELAQRFDAAGGPADYDDVPPRHRGLRSRKGAIRFLKCMSLGGD
jgi:hypothetical protein